MDSPNSPVVVDIFIETKHSRRLRYSTLVIDLRSRFCILMVQPSFEHMLTTPSSRFKFNSKISVIFNLLNVDNSLFSKGIYTTSCSYVAVYIGETGCSIETRL